MDWLNVLGSVSSIVLVYMKLSQKGVLILIGCAKVGRACTFDISYADNATAPGRCGYCDIIIYLKLNWHVEITQYKIYFSFSL